MFVEAAGQLSSYARAVFPSSVSRSADGQILVLTHGFLHILTPGLGLSLREDRSALSGYPGNKLPDQWLANDTRQALQSGECSGLTIFKTSIPVQRKSTEWEEFTIEPQLAVAGALDNGWRMASWSPSGLSDGGWCILAALTINCEVFIYGPPGDAVKSLWQEVFDLTAAYMDSVRVEPFVSYNASQLQTADEHKLQRDEFVIRTQNTSVAWSERSSAHGTRVDSLLAVGHKSGHVSFWKYDKEGSSMYMMMEQLVSEEWPVLMAWSNWKEAADRPSEQDVSSSLLAVAGPAGPVHLLRVSLLPDGKIECTLYESVCDSPKAVTILEWLDNETLAVGRLGEVTIWTRATTHHLRIPIEEFRGWTSMPTPINLVNLQASDALTIAMTDGTLRQVSGISVQPQMQTLQAEKSAQHGSLALSEDVRNSFMLLEKSGSRDWDKAPIPGTAAMYLSAFSQLDRNGLVFWAYERYQLDRRLYVMPNLRKLNFAIARCSRTDLEEDVLRSTTAALTEDVKTGCAVASNRTLFPTLLSLRHLMDQEDVLERLVGKVMGLVDFQYNPAMLFDSAEDYASFLLNDTSLQALRLGSLLLKYIHAHASVDATREKCQRLIRQLDTSLYLTVFRALDGLSSATTATTVTECSSKPHYVKIITALEDARCEPMQVDGEESDIDVFPSELDEEEKCAACSETIPFRQLGKGTCRNGHSWARCSISLAVMFTASGRTCTVCNRKSQLPNMIVAGSGINASADPTQRVLKTAKYCLFCGGRWSSIT